MKARFFLLLATMLAAGCSRPELRANMPKMISDMVNIPCYIGASAEDLSTEKAAARYGIAADDITEGYAIWMDSSAEIIIFAKACNIDALRALEEALENEAESTLRIYKNNDTLRKKAEARLLKTKGLYCIFAVGDSDSVEKIFDLGIR